VLPGRPKVIVYCAGDNDIAKLKAEGVETAVMGFGLFIRMVQAHAPFVRRIFYLGIHPSPSDELLWPLIEKANQRLRVLCDQSSLARFVDYNHLLHDEQGQICESAFLPDRLHFSAELYRQLGWYLRPMLEGELLSLK
jgi:hypothetical protein